MLGRIFHCLRWQLRLHRRIIWIDGGSCLVSCEVWVCTGLVARVGRRSDEEERRRMVAREEGGGGRVCILPFKVNTICIYE